MVNETGFTLTETIWSLLKTCCLYIWQFCISDFHFLLVVVVLLQQAKTIVEGIYRIVQLTGFMMAESDM